METRTENEPLRGLKQQLEKIGQNAIAGSKAMEKLDDPTSDAGDHLLAIANQLESEVTGLRRQFRSLPDGRVVFEWELKALYKFARDNKIGSEIIFDCAETLNGSVIGISALNYSSDIKIKNISALPMFSALRSLFLLETGQVKDMAPLNECRELTDLTIQSTQPNLYPIGNLTKLESLVLIDWRKLEDISGIEGLSRLTNLDLTCDKVKDYAPLGALIALELLEVHSGTAKDFTFLRHLPRLKELRASCSLFSDLSLLQNINDVVHLDVSDTPITDLKPLEQAQSLRELLMGETPIEDIGPLACLSRLVRLNLRNTGVRSIAALEHCISLEDLNLSGSQVDDIRPALGLPNLKQLEVYATPAAKTQRALIESYNGPIDILG